MGEAATHRFDPLGDVGRGRDVDAQPEAVEQLGAQLALLGVHRADEHEAGRVAVRDAVALDEVLAGGGDVEQHVDEVVGEQVDLVDVEHAAVGRGEQAGPERQLAAGQRGGRRRACRAGGPRSCRAAARRSAPSRPARPRASVVLAEPLCAAQQDAADQRVDGGQREGELGVVLADDGAERQAGRHRDSSHPSASRTAAVSVRRAASLAAHISRSAASRRRSAIARSAHGLDCWKNFRIASSPT